MKQTVRLSIGLLLTSLLFLFVGKTTAHAQASYIDQGLFNKAQTNDAIRKWDCPIATPDPNNSIPGPDQKLANTPDVTVREGINTFDFRDKTMTLITNLSGIGATLCPDRQIAFYQNSAIGSTGKLIAGLYTNPPASFGYYAYDVLHNGGFIKGAYAQGIGFPGLNPILPLWKTFRNISYTVVVVILVAVGFMIMFRMKINPQTVISIQSALPNIVITLLAITFSYAIAGLLIDLMYFSIMLIIAVFGQANLFNPAKVAEVQQYYLNANMGALFGSLITWDNVSSLPRALWGTMLVTGASGTVAAMATQLIGAFNPAGITIAILSFVGGALIPMLVIVIALFFVAIRVFFILLNSYIQIIISIIFAPFFLLMGAIPGNGAFSKWIKGLIGNLIVFPATATLFLISQSITASVAKTDGSLWSPPFIVGPSAGSKVIVGLIGLGFAMLTPTILNTVKQAIAGKPSLPINPGMILQPITALGGSGVQYFSWYERFGGKELINAALRKGQQTPNEPKPPGVLQTMGTNIMKPLGGGKRG